jgi:hypothetical protein
MIPNLPGSGNFLQDQYDPDEGHRFEDHYKCNCGNIVTTAGWVEAYKCCAECYQEMCEDQGRRWGEKV